MTPSVTFRSRSAHARRRQEHQAPARRTADAPGLQPTSAAESVLDLQRTVGNAAVARLLSSNVQRDVADEHVLTAEEERDLPATTDLPALRKELADLNVKAARLKKEGKTLEDAEEKRRKEIPRL